MTRLFYSPSIGLICFSFLALGCSSQQSEQPQPSTTVADEANVSMSANDSAPLMESLDPAKLGIDFVHLWKPKDRYEALMLKTGFTGGGVCMGDYDGDGLSDVVLTRPHGGLQLYRNLGDFRFETFAN